MKNPIRRVLARYYLWRGQRADAAVEAATEKHNWDMWAVIDSKEFARRDHWSKKHRRAARLPEPCYHKCN